MEQKWLCGLLAAALLLAAGCDGIENNDNNKFVESKLRGTWQSTNTSPYSGSLVIGFDAITISGYSESQPPAFYDDAKRPFRNLAKNAPYPCYTEDGKLFIETIGGAQGFPYVYSTSGSDRYLRFSFGGREEALKRTGD